METTATPVADTNLPPGVTHVGTPPAAATPGTPPATTPVTEYNDGGQVSFAGKMDIYKIGTGILITVLCFMGIYFFRERTFAATADSKEKEKKINDLNSEVVKIKQVLNS